jgi:hypothetical protein
MPLQKMKEVVIRNFLVAQVEMRCGLCELHVAPGQVGVPDCIVTWPDGRIEFVETKTKGGRLSVMQQRDHARRCRRGVFVAVLWSKTQVARYVSRYDHWILH